MLPYCSMVFNIRWDNETRDNKTRGWDHQARGNTSRGWDIQARNNYVRLSKVFFKIILLKYKRPL